MLQCSIKGPTQTKNNRYSIYSEESISNRAIRLLMRVISLEWIRQKHFLSTVSSTKRGRELDAYRCHCLLAPLQHSSSNGCRHAFSLSRMCVCVAFCSCALWTHCICLCSELSLDCVCVCVCERERERERERTVCVV